MAEGGMQQFVETLPNKFLGALASVGADVATGAYSTVGAMKYGVPEIMKRVPDEGWGAIGSGLDAATRMMPGGDYVADLQAAASDYATSQGVGPGAQMALGFLSPSLSDIGRGAQGAVRQMAKGEKKYAPGAMTPGDVWSAKHDPFGFGLKHTQDKPFDELEFSAVDGPPLAPRGALSIEDLEGKTLVPVPGDRATTGGFVTEIEGVKLTEPVSRDGGAYYPRGKVGQSEGSVWAANTGTASKYRNRVNAEYDAGAEDVVGIYGAMSAQGIDFNASILRAATRMIPNMKITKKAKRAFDADVRKTVKGAKDWPGLDSPDLEAYLDRMPGTARTEIVKRLDQVSHRKAGFPSVGAIRKAFTEPDLYDANIGDMGEAVFRLDRDMLIDPASQTLSHPSYSHQFSGEYLGALSSPVPFRDLFPDFTRARRAAGDPVGSDFRALGSVPYTQRVTPEVVDHVSRYLELMKRRGQ